MKYNYFEAVSRNLGWMSEYEQIKLKNSRVAICGLGGVGGIYLLTCVRLGISQFNLAEFDSFELGNFNRQVGATLSTLEHPKIEVMVRQALDINPNLDIKIFPKGISESSVDDFLEGADVYLDGIDVFEIHIRRLIFKACQERGIPAITCGPIGMGFAQLVFAEGSPKFDEFFDFKSYPEEEHPLIFVAGLAPKALQRGYIYDPSRVHFKENKVPSTIMGCDFCAGAAVTEALKHILKRGNRMQAPHGLQYDAHENQFRKTNLRWGNRGLLQRLKIQMIRKQIRIKNDLPYAYKPLPEIASLSKDVNAILDLARWAPSGHNEQLCHLRVKSSDEIIIQVNLPSLPLTLQERERIAYTHFGIYLESLEQAASHYGYEVKWEENQDPLNFKISFNKNAAVKPIDTALYLRARFTDRRPYLLKPIDADHLKKLRGCLDENYHLIFKGSLPDRMQFATNEARNFSITMKDEELFKFNMKHIDLQNPYSPKTLPFASLAFSKATNFMFKFFMQRPELLRTLNKVFGYLPVAFEYAFLRQLMCAGHFVITRDNEDQTKDLWIQDGQMIQRLWLTACSLGIALQPSFFHTIVKQDESFLIHPQSGIKKAAQKIKAFFEKNTGAAPERIIFMGRIGYPKDRRVYSRSTRKTSD